METPPGLHGASLRPADARATDRTRPQHDNQARLLPGRAKRALNEKTAGISAGRFYFHLPSLLPCMPWGGPMAVTLQRNMGMLLLGVWLVLYGLAGMIALNLPSPLMAVLALLAGILILVGR